MPVKTLPVKMLLLLRHVPFRGGAEQLHDVHILGVLDSWGHKRGILKMFQRPLCDAWDWYLGVHDDDIPVDSTEVDELQ